MFKIEKPPSIDNCYILITDKLIEKTYSPYLYGDKLKKIMQDSMSILENYLKIKESEKILIIRILEGGKYYYPYETLRKRHKELYLYDIKITSRYKYLKNKIATKIIEQGKIEASKFGVNRILIGDTIASGSTILTLLNFIEDYINHETKFEIFGFITYYGYSKINEWFVKRNIKCTFYPYIGLLHLGKNLTDMILTGKDSIVPRYVIDSAITKLGEEIVSNLCIIGDFTDSFENINEYIAERMVQLWEIGRNTSNKDTKRIIKMLIKEGYERLINNGLETNIINNLLNRVYVKRQRLLGIKILDKHITLNKLMELD